MPVKETSSNRATTVVDSFIVRNLRFSECTKQHSHEHNLPSVSGPMDYLKAHPGQRVVNSASEPMEGPNWQLTAKYNRVALSN